MNRFARSAPLAALFLVIVIAGDARACTNPLELVMERGAYDREFKSKILDLSATLDAVDASLNAGTLAAASAGLDTLLEKWFAVYTRYASTPPDGWRGRDGWLESLSDVTRALKALHESVAHRSEAGVVHERMQDLNVALSLLFKEDLPFDPTEFINTDNWPLVREANTETDAPHPRAVEDAGFLLGRRTLELLDGIERRTAAVELSTAGAGTCETEIADRFVRAFRRIAESPTGGPAAFSLFVNPREQLSLLTASEVRGRTGASLRVLCRYGGAATREREFRPGMGGVRMRRIERVRSARFRVIADALDGERDPLLVEEFVGRFIHDTVYHTGTDEIEVVKSEYRAYEHFPGIDACGDDPGAGEGDPR